MRIRFEFDSDVAIRKLRVRFRERVLARLDPMGYEAPTRYLCSCGFLNIGELTQDNYRYYVDRCMRCGASNPRYEEYEFLNGYRPPGHPRAFMGWVARHAEDFEQVWAKKQRRIDAAKTADKKRGLKIGNRPHTQKREGEAN